MSVQTSLQPANAPVTEPVDPLARITLAPRTFVAVLATIALVVGLLLALLPVRVSTPDTVNMVKVSCGNTLGGVETPHVASALNRPAEMVLVSYIAMCDRAIDSRTTPAWTLFFGGMLGWIWLGVVRTKKSRVE